jgi:hypothetical protein
MKELITQIRDLLQRSRYELQQTVNTAMVKTYWGVGKLIVEDEQHGARRAIYGAQQLQLLSQELQIEFGKGFDTTNLRNMRKFYLQFPIQETVSPKLSWSHYCKLIRIENEKARQWYLNEAIEQNWSVRALDRQISKLYYERLLSSREPQPVIQEADNQTKKVKLDVKDYLRDPYILDFLNFKFAL